MGGHSQKVEGLEGVDGGLLKSLQRQGWLSSQKIFEEKDAVPQLTREKGEQIFAREAELGRAVVAAFKEDRRPIAGDHLPGSAQHQ